MRKTIVLFLIVVALSICGCSSTASTPASSSAESSTASSVSSSSASRVSVTANTVFGFAEQYDVKSGSGASIGTVSVFRAASSDCTVENLELWCNQYLRWDIDNWAVIEYTDKPGYGVYGSGTLVEVDVSLASYYSIADDSEAVFYVFNADDITENGHLSKVEG